MIETLITYAGPTWARYFVLRDASIAALFDFFWHLKAKGSSMAQYLFRTPAEPSPPPIQDPTDPPENPDVPVREPEPDDPNQI
jgi:hypothetical protein